MCSSQIATCALLLIIAGCATTIAADSKPLTIKGITEDEWRKYLIHDSIAGNVFKMVRVAFMDESAVTTDAAKEQLHSFQRQAWSGTDTALGIQVNTSALLVITLEKSLKKHPEFDANTPLHTLRKEFEEATQNLLKQALLYLYVYQTFPKHDGGKEKEAREESFAQFVRTILPLVIRTCSAEAVGVSWVTLNKLQELSFYPVAEMPDLKAIAGKSTTSNPPPRNLAGVAGNLWVGTRLYDKHTKQFVGTVLGIDGDHVEVLTVDSAQVKGDKLSVSSYRCTRKYIIETFLAPPGRP